MKQYLELEELNKNDILFLAPVFNSEWLQLEDPEFQSWNGPGCPTV